MLGYDIVCQYLIYLLLRFQMFGHLNWPDFIRELTGVVGVWHIFAHVPECFGRFSSLYGWAIGIIDGEILETLWSLLNLITESCRNMSRANREETISFYIADMNFKKLIDLGQFLFFRSLGTFILILMCVLVPSISRKYRKYSAQHPKRLALLNGLSALVSQENQDKWRGQLAEAYARCSIDPHNRDEYNPKWMDGFLRNAHTGTVVHDYYATCPGILTGCPAPDLRAAEIRLIQRDTEDSDVPGLAKFVITGLNLQEEQ